MLPFLCGKNTAQEQALCREVQEAVDSGRVTAELREKLGLPGNERVAAGLLRTWAQDGTIARLIGDVQAEQVRVFENGGNSQNVPIDKRLPIENKKINIPMEKFTQYALNSEKDPNKALAFEKALGYNLNNAEELIADIYNNINNFEAIKKPDNGYGDRYQIVMQLTGPNGKIANVLTAWLDDKYTGEIRLISAYVID